MGDIPQYDVAIIGSGPGGYVAAIRAGQLGLSTVLIEKEPRFGGTCLHWGCIPTKALLLSAEVHDFFKNGREYGIECKEFTLDWAAVQARKQRIVTKLAKGIEYLLRKNKVETIQGRGRLAGAERIAVTDAKNQTHEVLARKIVLATGSEAKLLPGLAADGQRILTNKEVLELKSIPKSMVVVGAGAVGVEFASIFHRFGCQVTLLEMLSHAVPLEDEEISVELEKAFRKQGIPVHTRAAVQKATRSNTGVEVTWATPDGKTQTLAAETLLVATGRAPNTFDLGMEKTRIATERGFVKVDSTMQTSEPGVYAIGDIVAGSPLLAHVASMEGIVAVTHAAGKPVEPINYAQAPSCTFCEPQIASVGLTERAARETGHSVRVGKFPFSANSKATILGVREGFIKMICDSQYGETLGVHVIGPGATELIAEPTLAMRLEGSGVDISHTIHPHPTLSEAMLEAAHAVYGVAIHV